MGKPKPARYRTTNWSTYNDALRKRGSLLIWLDKEMTWHAQHEGRPGRPPVFSSSAIQFCLSIKVLFKLPLRQTAGMVARLLHLAGWTGLFQTIRRCAADRRPSRCESPIAVPADRCICWWTAPASSSSATVNGRPASRASKGAANGARYIWRWTPPPRILGPSSSILRRCGRDRGHRDRGHTCAPWRLDRAILGAHFLGRDRGPTACGLAGPFL